MHHYNEIKTIVKASVDARANTGLPVERNDTLLMQTTALVSTMSPCGKCLGCAREDYCEVVRFPMVTDKQMNDPDWLRDARNFVSSLDIGRYLMVSEIFDLNQNRTMGCKQRDKYGNWVVYDPPMEKLFIPSDEIIESGQAEEFLDSLRDWLGSFFCKDVPVHINPYVTQARREHAQCILTLFGCAYSEKFVQWGVRPVTSDGEA